MARLLIAAVLVAVLLPAVASAATLEVSGGGLLMWQLGLFDTCGTLSGNGFPQIIACSNSPQLFPPLDGTTLTQFHVPLANINGLLYMGPPMPNPPIPPINLRMLFVHDPIPPLNEVNGPISTPFTMTGTLDLFHPVTNDPVVFDLVGHGMLNCCYRPDPLSSLPLVAVDVTFSVPEPASVVLLGVAIAPPVFLLGVRARRKARAA